MPTRTILRTTTVLLGLAVGTTSQVKAQGEEPYRKNLPADHPAITYDAGPVHDAVGQLARAVEAGEVRLAYDAQFGYLPSLLRHLDVNTDSQALVFSKTSFQSPLISPRAPRAIYFSDTAAVGVVRGASVIELAGFDPRRGAVFYTLDAARSDSPRFDRPRRCLQCHQQAATLGVPGPYIGSVTTSVTGRPNFGLGTVVTDHRTPFEARWGGWYVTGTHGSQQHRGNAMARDPAAPAGLVDPARQNLRSLQRFIDVDEFLVPTSDLIALMTFEHQTQMINLLTRIGWETRLADHDGLLDAVETRARLAGIEEIVRYMLFVDETPLTDEIEGVSSFTETFEARGPHDSQGRSLRDFDLRSRLFRYPLSFMIYSDLFDGLPGAIKEPVYERLFEVLSADDGVDGFDALSPADRRAIVAIVQDTKTGLPGYWTAE